MFSAGNWGNEIDGQNIHAAPQAFSDSDEDEEAQLLPKEQEKKTDSFRSYTPERKPETIDNNYWYIPGMEEEKPLVYLKFNTEDHRRRFYNQNILFKIINKMVRIVFIKGYYTL